MKPEKINKLINEFLGLKPHEYQGKFYINLLPDLTLSEDTLEKTMESFNKSSMYSTKWSWLMPVVERIQKSGWIFKHWSSENAHYCEINDIETNGEFLSYKSSGESVILAYFNVVGTFLADQIEDHLQMDNNELIIRFLGADGPINEDNEFDVYALPSMNPIFENIEGRLAIHIDDTDIKHFYSPEEMLFDKSWDWLMLVVQRIERLNYDVQIGSGNYCRIWNIDPDRTNGMEEIESSQPTLFNTVYDAVIKFIENYKVQ